MLSPSAANVPQEPLALNRRQSGAGIGTGVGFVNRQASLIWESFPGKHYTIQGSNGLSGAWENLLTGVPAAVDPNNHTSATVETVVAGQPRRFYRVMEE